MARKEIHAASELPATEQAEMAHLEERIKKEVPEAAKSRTIADFKVWIEELFNGINGQT